ETEENETTQSFWEMIFGNDDDEEEVTEVNETEVNNTNNNNNNQSNNSNDEELETCSELNFLICDDEQKCDGALIDGKDAQCCDGSCVPKSESKGFGSTVGWIIIGVAAIFLVWFFKVKFSRARMTSGRFFRR
ncbi:MAG: hypothetical protein Q8Q04_03565, partial [archaeon]|nr:hypothetical protein [archaeon]